MHVTYSMLNFSIRDGQNYLMGRQIGSEFNHHSGDGQPYSVDFVALAKSFGFGVAAKVLANLGVDLNKVRSAVEFIMLTSLRLMMSWRLPSSISLRSVRSSSSVSSPPMSQPCGATMATGSRFCSACGGHGPEAVACTACGVVLELPRHLLRSGWH